MMTRYEKILRAGHEISGGFGFWGSYGLKTSWYMQELVKAWVDALTELGFSDYDIVFYGDWTDGRHIADYIDPKTRYAAFKKIVKENAKPIGLVAGENATTYLRNKDAVAEVTRIFQGRD